MNSQTEQLRKALRALPALDLSPALAPKGIVLSVGDGVAQVAGIAETGAEELVQFDSGAIGLAYDIDTKSIGVVMLAGENRVRAGEGVRALGQLPSVPTGKQLLGRLVDPLGRSLDGLPAPGGPRLPALGPAPALIDRAPVHVPLVTGVSAIDAAIPIGRGQRQLVVGDRNVGKTSLALDVVVAQLHSDVPCVYVTIGQPLSRVLAIREALIAQNALDHVVLLAAEAADPPGLQYLAPYAGMAVAEGFRKQGADVLLVFDDLTKHADAYRELSLLLGRPPGREAYPGDIFYIHAELLERATAFSKSAGGGSITALPLVETTEGDISAYIPTNLISITDGQLYLDSGRFERNQRPAIDIGKSVSRIGGAAQDEAMRAIARNLRIDLSRFEALEALTRVGLDVDLKTEQTLRRGRLLRELLRQPRFAFRAVSQQLVTLLAVEQGLLSAIPAGEVRQRVSSISEADAEAVLALRAAPADPAQEHIASPAFVAKLSTLLKVSSTSLERT